MFSFRFAVGKIQYVTRSNGCKLQYFWTIGASVFSVSLKKWLPPLMFWKKRIICTLNSCFFDFAK